MEGQQVVAVLKADQLGHRGRVVISLDMAKRADIGRKSAAFDHLSVKAADMAEHGQLARAGCHVDIGHQRARQLSHRLPLHRHRPCLLLCLLPCLPPAHQLPSSLRILPLPDREQANPRMSREG